MIVCETEVDMRTRSHLNKFMGLYVYQRNIHEPNEKTRKSSIKCKNMQYLYPYSAICTCVCVCVYVRGYFIRIMCLCSEKVLYLQKLGALPGSDNEITSAYKRQTCKHTVNFVYISVVYMRMNGPNSKV